MSTRQPRDVARRPTIVAHGGGHERLMPLLASLAAGQDSRLQSAADGRSAELSQQFPEVVEEEEEEEEEWNSSDEYDTDLEQIDKSSADKNNSTTNP